MAAQQTLTLLVLVQIEAGLPPLKSSTSVERDDIAVDIPVKGTCQRDFPVESATAWRWIVDWKRGSLGTCCSSISYTQRPKKDAHRDLACAVCKSGS